MTDRPKIKLGLVGVGKIARDQHLPAIATGSDFVLAASASRHATVEGLPAFETLAAMLDAHPEIEAVALCTPPQVRHGLAKLALERGKHVLLEKPPGATLSEVEDLRDIAERADRTLFATWHSRFGPAVEPARAWVAERRVLAVRINWKEDVRVWHPGQDWIWEPGGLGVFDPGVNALSIATQILPAPFFLTQATLRFPENRQAPIAAELSFVDAEGVAIEAVFDFLQTGPQSWDIEIDTDRGQAVLSHGGAKLTVDGVLTHEGPVAEYDQLYARFGQLIRDGRSDVDVSPLRHVADAFLRGRRVTAPAFLD